MEPWKIDLCRRMPKAELHLHLDGALNAGIAARLASDAGWEGFSHPLDYRELYGRLVVPGNLSSQKELLAYFALPGALLHTEEALRLVTRQLLIEKAADNVRYCEIRWAPALHTARGLSTGQVVELVLDECRRVAAATGQVVRLIAVGMRTMSLAENLTLLEEIAPYAGSELAAVDLAGPEEEYPDALAQAEFFTRARQLGFGVTLHCGELPQSAGRLRRQAEALLPRRIAHGPGAAEDPALCAWLREHDIMLDLCPTSNIQSGLYPNHQAYPLKTLRERGVPVSVNTDDNVLSGLSLSDEYGRLLDAGQIDLPGLWRCNLDALAHAFLPEEEIGRLIREFTAWGSLIPELSAR